MVTPIELGTNPNNMKQGVFVALVCEKKVWEKYEGIAEEAKKTVVPVVLMLQRWDGFKGFPGGEVESSESLKEAALRECIEEIGFSLNEEEQESMTLVSSHKASKIVTHLFVISLPENRFNLAIKESINAEHYGSEVAGVLQVPFMNYPHKASFDNFIKNNFATSVKEEISDLITTLEWDKKYNLPVNFVEESATQSGMQNATTLLNHCYALPDGALVKMKDGTEIEYIKKDSNELFVGRYFGKEDRNPYYFYYNFIEKIVVV